ncbi:zinc ribbon domain-containing protein [bacterium]|nr:zinc ribbon domain-containing protein [bacterium]
MNSCKHCGTPNSPQRHYCKNCGRRIVAFCSQCGFANETGTLFCGGCGRKLVDSEPRDAASQTPKAASVMQESASSLSTEELSQLEKINRHRRQTLDVAGSRQNLEQEDLDKLFGKESK